MKWSLPRIADTKYAALITITTLLNAQSAILNRRIQRLHAELNGPPDEDEIMRMAQEAADIDRHMAEAAGEQPRDTFVELGRHAERATISSEKIRIQAILNAQEHRRGIDKIFDAIAKIDRRSLDTDFSSVIEILREHVSLLEAEEIPTISLDDLPADKRVEHKRYMEQDRMGQECEIRIWKVLISALENG
ncbi:MAG: hypothetical protein KBD06_00025 [Candidatus Pacebacteria bacterium]|nr:hypothetical protein [Candidatus Paceibacterota bacterium]